jgi:hypothetical protein
VATTPAHPGTVSVLRQPSARPVGAPAEKWNAQPLIRFFVFPVLLAGVFIATVNFFTDTRLPVQLYLLFIAIQVLAIGTQMIRKYLLTATMGATFTVVLLWAALIDLSPAKDFDGYLVPWVYRTSLIAGAYSVLLGSTCLFHVLSLRFLPAKEWVWSKSDLAETLLSERLSWIALIFGAVISFMTMAGENIAQQGYALVPDSNDLGTKFASLPLFGNFLLCLALVAAVRHRGWNSARFKFMLVVTLIVTIYTQIIRGHRGGPLAIAATIVLLFYMNSKMSTVRKHMVLFIGSALLIGFMQMMGTIRASAYVVGTWRATQYAAVELQDVTQHPMRFNLFPQMYWQLLHILDLRRVGISLDGRTFIDLVKQAIPSFVADLIGYQRPLPGAWLLARYRVHGGGMFIIAEGVWNFGYAGGLLIAAACASIAIGFERWYRKQEPLVAASYLAFIGTLGFGAYYGLQPFSKALQMTIIIALLSRFIMQYYRRKLDYKISMQQLLLRQTASIKARGVPEVNA